MHVLSVEGRPYGALECETDRARFLGAANVLHRIAADRWRGDMTDGTAMVAALRRAGFKPKRKRALVIGAGGAGSAGRPWVPPWGPSWIANGCFTPGLGGVATKTPVKCAIRKMDAAVAMPVARTSKNFCVKRNR